MLLKECQVDPKTCSFLPLPYGLVKGFAKLMDSWCGLKVGPNYSIQEGSEHKGEVMPEARGGRMNGQQSR